jgi:hypothetical protein
MFLYGQIYWLAEFGDTVSCLQFNYLRVETLTFGMNLCIARKVVASSEAGAVYTSRVPQFTLGFY